MLSSPTDKSALRRHFRQIRDGLSEAERQKNSRLILNRLKGLPLYAEAKILLLYAPIGSEVDLLPLVADARDTGKTVAFPVSHKETRTLSFHAVSDLCQLRVGAYGIREPDSSLPPLSLDSAHTEALCLTPALSYDRLGFRLGYGGGYYDRLLSAYPLRAVGVCFGDCLCDRLPRGEYDRQVDLILTEGGIILPHDETEQS